MWKPQHKGDTKADAQRDDGQEQAAFLFYEELDYLSLAHLSKMV